ncbi:MAG: GGDEF domain-containing protein [Sulfuricurvum sp.]|nr:GGDEF domain-containing protein [Sulfuricurvum sp.]
MEEERFAYFLKDQLTGLNNHWALESILQINMHTHEYRYATVICLENLITFNRQMGWHNGDILLEKFAEILKNRFTHHHIYRIFGDTFVILSEDFLDLSPDSLREADFFENTNITITVTVTHLIEKKIDTISKLEETISSKK